MRDDLNFSGHELTFYQQTERHTIRSEWKMPLLEHFRNLFWYQITFNTLLSHESAQACSQTFLRGLKGKNSCFIQLLLHVNS